MGRFSKIAWTDHTFNPWIGCQRVSPGCLHCYAEHETFVRKERSAGRELWGPTGFRHRTSAFNWQEPDRWNRANFFDCLACGWRGNLLAPTACPACGVTDLLRPTRQRVFCMSLGDLLEDRTDVAPWRLEVFDLIERTPNLDWLLLTKRIDLAGTMFPSKWLEGTWPKNAWLGTSIEDQKRYDERVPELAKIPAVIRFLSIEPMLGPIDLRVDRWGEEATEIGFNWVIVGGESGSKCRAFDIQWARDVRDQCEALGVHFFMKQLGGYPNKHDMTDDLPEDLRIRVWPDARAI